METRVPHEIPFLNNFEMGPPKDHFYQIWYQLTQRFRRSIFCNLRQKFDGHMDGQSDDSFHKISKAHNVTV